MRKFGIVCLLSVLVSTGFSQDEDKEYHISWLGLGKEGRFHVSKPGKPHTIKLDLAELDPGEVYEVEVYFDNNLIETLKVNGDSTVHTPLSKGKYGLRFYRIEKGKRIRVKPKIVKGALKRGTKSREGLRVTSSSSGGTITATVDA